MPSLVKLFAIPVEDGDPAPAADTDLSFADTLLRNGQDKKRRRLAASKYRSTEHVTATSNICERLFSAARLILNHLRSHMDPNSCELLLFLKVNKEFWASPRIIDQILKERGDTVEADDSI
jgi:hypothetical protein